MKILLDENLSPKLVESLQEEFPESIHVRAAELRGADDQRIWKYARDHGFTIVSKDNDFRQRSFLAGPPPKVVWLDVGNAGTRVIEAPLRREHATILTFERDEQSELLVVPLVVRAV